MMQTQAEVANSSALRSVIATVAGFLTRWAVTKVPQLASVAPDLQEVVADVIGVIVGAIVKWFSARWTARSVSVVAK